MVHTTREAYHVYKFSNFKTNLKNLRESIARGPKKPKAPKWRSSEAKKLLYEDICSSKVQPEMTGDEVFLMRAEYKLYKLENFKTNLKNLREGIANNYEKMSKDRAWYKHDSARIKILRADQTKEDYEICGTNTKQNHN